MSVILRKTNSRKHKHKAVHRHDSATHSHSQQLEPPISNDHTTVWLTDVDSIPTTLLLNKNTFELWCNGSTIDASGLNDEGEFEFDIFHQSTSTTTVLRFIAMSSRGGEQQEGEAAAPIHYRLYVNGKLVPEHTSASVSPRQSPRATSVNHLRP